MSQHLTSNPLRRIAAAVGVAGAIGAGVYGLSVAAASAQAPTSTTPPTTTPSKPHKPSDDNPYCPNMGGQDNKGTSSSSESDPAV